MTKPGQILMDDFITPRGSSLHILSLQSTISYSTLLDITKGKQKITPIIAKRLASVYPVPASYWMELQKQYDEKH